MRSEENRDEEGIWNQENQPREEAWRVTGFSSSRKTNMPGEEGLTEEGICGHPHRRDFPSSLPCQDLLDAILKPEDRTDFGHEPTEVHGRNRYGQRVSCGEEGARTPLTGKITRDGEYSGGSQQHGG